MTAEQLEALEKLGEELSAVEECLESMRLDAQDERREVWRHIDGLTDAVNVQNAHLAAICAKLGVRSELMNVQRRPNPAARLPRADATPEADPDASTTA